MRLIGHVDGVEISFDFHPPSTFTAEIPRQLDGTYILQLQAIDDAGNVTNYSNIFIKIDFSALKFQMLESPFGFIHNGTGLAYFELAQLFNTMEIGRAFENQDVAGFTYREVVTACN